MGFNSFFDEPKFDFNAERKKFIDNLDFLKSMSVQEQTLYKKWQEFNADVYSMTQKASKFPKIKKSIWMPTDINNKEQTIKEIEALEPYVEAVKQGHTEGNEMWTLARKLLHTMEFTANPGRNLKFYIKDKKSGKILGVILKFEGDIKKSSVYPAIIIGYDAVKDLALLGIKGKFPEHINLIIPKNSFIEVGSDVHAIGHPKSYAWTYTKGYVSQIPVLDK